MERRGFIRGLLGSSLGSLLGIGQSRVLAAAPGFEHGVASGDPLSDRVILWTRVSGCTDPHVDVEWQLAADDSFRNLVARGHVQTGAYRDYTVKVDVTGLAPGRTWYYRFVAAAPTGDAVNSPVGRTRTLPAGHVGRVRFAVASCANYPYGYFHAYRDIAQHDDLDAVVHLGDYIYEYGLGGYATERAEALGRIPQPRHDAVSLPDFRLRYGQYRSDPDLQAMHAAHPVIAVWDDHEFANDAWRGGAQNHGADDGQWSVRRDAAIQAWLEWMPVRAGHEQADTRICRQFRFGDLVTLIMLDTRIAGRDRQPDNVLPGHASELTPASIEAVLRDPERGLLGLRQEQWLHGVLSEANTTWQVIGQQVMVAPTRAPSLGPLLDLDKPSMLSAAQLEGYIETSRDNPPMLLDTWNGYPYARARFLGKLASVASNPVVLSGDLHTSMAANLFASADGPPVAVELMAGSITSPGFAEYLPERRPGAVRDATLALNPSIAYMETDRRGWMKIELSHELCRAEWRLLDTVHERDFKVTVDCELHVRAGAVSKGLARG